MRTTIISLMAPANSHPHATNRCTSCEPTRDDCEPRSNTVGSGAINVSRKPRLESMIVGREGCSIASRTPNECKPQHLAARSEHDVTERGAPSWGFHRGNTIAITA
jgi:hypothetical protein